MKSEVSKLSESQFLSALSISHLAHVECGFKPMKWFRDLSPEKREEALDNVFSIGFGVVFVSDIE